MAKSRKIIPVVATVLVIGAGVGYLFYSSAGEAFEYYKHVDEVVAEHERWEGRHLQIHGFVLPDSIARRLDRDHQQIEYKFRAVNCGREIEVRYQGTVPDTFKDRAEVVCKGTLGTDGVFQATEVSAKCPSKYESSAPSVTMCTRDRSPTQAAN